MPEIKVGKDESFDSALRRFKRECQRSGILRDFRKREHYLSPSVKRRKKSEAARQRKTRRRFRYNPQGNLRPGKYRGPYLALNVKC